MVKTFHYFLAGVPEKLGGAICMHYDETHGKGEFLWTHTTASMGLAYQTTSDLQATTVMSRLDPIEAPKVAGGTFILVDSIPFVTKLTPSCGTNGLHCSMMDTNADQGNASTTAKIQSAKA